MDDLISRLREAKQGSRELDFWITCMIWDGPLKPGEYEACLEDIANPNCGIEGMYVEKPFTQSIDAAVALIERVLPGWWWGLTQGDDEDDAIEFQGNVWPGIQPFPADFEKYGHHASPALALCIAALTALKEQSK